MGSCLSKKNACAFSSPERLPEKIQSDTQIEKNKPQEETHAEKEIFIIKNRKSYEIERQPPQEEKIINESKINTTETLENGSISTPDVENDNAVLVGGAAVRTSSCTKDELDAILIQCGRLSRSSSTGKTVLSESGGRKYSGSKRSYDFDNEVSKSDGKNVLDDDAVCKERENRRKNRQSQGRRRTPSRERERENRSGSQERSGSGGGGRRVSRSPGKRSESPINSNGSNANANANYNSNPNSNASSRPGKMVSVPATVSSLVMDKSTNGGEPNSVKRNQVKRNVGGDGVGSRTGASPRAKSPARTRAESQNLSLSRSNSRKADHSPYRRNPLSEIDNNVISQADIQKPNAESRAAQIAEKRPNITKVESNMTNVNCKTKEQQQSIFSEESKIAVNLISSGPHSVNRTRSSRLSRDLDINPETLSNPPNSSYTALLLEDIQNFHQKSTNAATTPPPPAFTLPPCVTKACSILEAVADLNSSTGSTNFSEERRRNFINSQISKSNAYVESEVVVAHDDLMEPSFHKYVTVRRGTVGGAEMEEQESSAGSNSFVSSQQLLGSSSSWEPNSAESTDRWTSSSSRSISRNNEQRNAITDKHQNVIGRGRIRLSGVTAAST